MSFESIISHMNDHHKENLIDLLKKFGGVKEFSDVSLKSVDYEGLDIAYNGDKTLRIEFPVKATESTIKNTIIELCMSVKQTTDYELVKKEVLEFKKGFGSVCLASLSIKGEAECSYTPIIQTQFGDYIYVSEVADHYSNIKNNPNNIEVMFLEDESKAASVILRKRLRYRVKAVFIERGADFDKIYDEFEKQSGGGGGIKTIRNMLDFHLIKLEYGEGRFVKGFGQAYKLFENGDIKHLGGSSPHKRSPHS